MPARLEGNAQDSAGVPALIPNVAEVISKPFSVSRGLLSNFDKLWPEREHSQWPDLH